MTDAESFLNRELDATNGFLRLEAAFVARDFYPGLGRLGVKNYRVGRRGWICERWIASTVRAENVYKLENEGLSFIAFSKSRTKVSFAQSLELIPSRMLGEKYAKKHNNRFGVLTKILDIGVPIPWHIHAREEDAKRYWNMNGKEEAVVDLIDWEKARDPYFYRKYHTVPEKVVGSGEEEHGVEYWALNPNRTWKFSGKELRVLPGRTFESRENGAYAILVWKGEGRVGNLKVKAGDSKLDELFVSYEAAVEPHKITNTGRQELGLYKIFGPDVNRAAIVYDSLEY